MVELRAPGGIAEHRIDNMTLILPGIVIVLLIGWFICLCISAFSFFFSFRGQFWRICCLQVGKQHERPREKETREGEGSIGTQTESHLAKTKMTREKLS